MRIKCPRCGLVNKPNVKKCQSCGEDFSDLLDLGIDYDEKEQSEEIDPLSIDNIKKSRRRVEKSSPPSNSQSPLDLDWKEELNRRVSEIKRERSAVSGNVSLPQSATKRKISERPVQESERKYKIKDEMLRHKPGAYTSIDDEDEEYIPHKKTHGKKSKVSEVYDDNHLEDYDYEAEEAVEEDTAGEEADFEEEEHERRTGAIFEKDSEEENDEPNRELPKDREDIKRYIEEKVARRKGKSTGMGRELSEEYGYRPRSKERTSQVSSNDARRKTRYDNELDENNSYYDSKTIYRPVDDEKPETPSDRLLSDETKSLLNSKRIYAGIWDNIILLAITLIICKFGANATDITILQLFSASWLKILVFHLLLCGFYNVYFIGSNGQTIGKMFMHIRLMTDQGRQISFTRAFMHYIFTLVGIAFATVGYFWFFYSRQNKNWADMAAGVKTELFRN